MTKHEVSTLSRLPPRDCCLLYNIVHFYTADVTISDHCAEMSREIPRKSEIPARGGHVDTRSS